MSYLKKYVIILTVLVGVVNVTAINLVYAQSLDGQLQELREKMEKEKKALAKLVAESATENISFDNPLDARKDVEKQIFLDKDTPETVKLINDIKESRYEERRESIFQSFVFGAKSKFDKNSSQMDVDSTVELVKTMPGRSEGSGVYSEVVLKEMVILMTYIRAELTNLRREATVSAAEISHLKSPGNITETFNMCQYYTERRKKKSVLDMGKGLVNKAKKAYETGQNVAAQVSENVAAVNELKDITQSMIGEAQDMKFKDLAGGM